MHLFLAILAAAAYTTGGVFMKQSHGLTRLVPAILVFACFLFGSAAQSISMRHSQMSANYVVVLGLEAALALVFGIALLGETLSLRQAAGALLVVAGVGLLRLD